MGSRPGTGGSLIYPPRVLQPGARQSRLVGHFSFSAKFICMGKQKNRLTTLQAVPDRPTLHLGPACPARLALPEERPLELTKARLPGKPPTLQRGTLTSRLPGLPQLRPTPASLPCTSYIDTQAEAAAFSRAQVRSAYPGAGSRGEEPVVANAWQQDQHQHHTDLPYTGRHTPLQLSVKRRHHWGNRGEGRLTLSRS